MAAACRRSIAGLERPAQSTTLRLAASGLSAGRPRRHAPAAGALQLGEGEATLAAGDVDAPRRRPRRSLRAGRRRRPTTAAPAVDRLAGEDAARAGERVERAQAPLDRRRGLAPVDRRLALSILCGVGRRLPRAAAAADEWPPAERRRAPRTTRSPPSAASAAVQRWRSVSSAPIGERLGEQHRRRCRGRRPSA